jgi:hypothetical protein
MPNKSLVQMVELDAELSQVGSFSGSGPGGESISGRAF